jgi:hypothetical protein
MTLSPVSLAEFRSHLNFTEADGHADDEELWTTLLSAVDMVEQRCGALRVRQVTETVSLWYPYQANWTDLGLSKWPLYGGIVSVTDVSDASAWARYYRYTVVYNVGREPIPDVYLEMVKLQAGLMWSTQRGPAASPRFTAMGGDGVTSPGGVDRSRLDYLYRDYGVPAFA